MKAVKLCNLYLLAAGFSLAPVTLAVGADFPCEPVLFNVASSGWTNPPQRPGLAWWHTAIEHSILDTARVERFSELLGLGGATASSGFAATVGPAVVGSAPMPSVPTLPDLGLQPSLPRTPSLETTPIDPSFRLPQLPAKVPTTPSWPVIRTEKPKLILDERTKITLGDLFRTDPRIQRQSDPVVALKEAKQRGTLNFTPAEQRRQASSSTCSSAYRDLVTQFETHRSAIGFWTESTRTVADFVPWYYQADLPAENRERAAPIVHAQERFGKACMEGDIPSELNPSLVQRAVGILMFGDKVFCTALRLSKDEILTAKHCFVNQETGATSGDVNAVRANLGQIWFAYEAEPNHRFGVCKASLPNAGGPFGPSSDNIRIRISNTNTPPAPIKWAPTPVKLGTSLYLRGFFPFAEGANSTLARMRSTAVGGCFAHSGADRCFFHACQTTSIMSGAPIFVRPEPGEKQDALEVAGMHLGSALLSDPNERHGSICSGIDGTKVPSSNFAYQP